MEPGNPQVTTRRRGAKLVGIAVLLLLLAVILMALLAPEPGAHYPWVLRLVCYALTGTGWGALLVGLYRVIVGPGTGALAGVLKLVAIGAMVVGVGLGLFGAWAVHTIVDAPGRAASGDHHDWDD